MTPVTQATLIERNAVWALKLESWRSVRFWLQSSNSHWPCVDCTGMPANPPSGMNLPPNPMLLLPPTPPPPMPASTPTPPSMTGPPPPSIEPVEPPVLAPPSRDGGASTGGSTGSMDGGGGPVMDGGVGVDAGMGGGGVGGSSNMGFGGKFIPDGGFAGMPVQSTQGQWEFDDCNQNRTDLQDSSFNAHTAFRSISVACVTGMIQQGIGIDQDEDLVYVPDQPDFTFENGVTVGAWVNPNKLNGVRTIFRKRESGTSTFVLLTNGRNYQFVIRLANGRAASVSAPAKAGIFTHVAATYDGQALRLYLNGALADHTRVKGVLSNGAGPLLMGNDALQRRMDGALDTVFFQTRSSSDAEVLRLACIPHPSTM